MEFDLMITNGTVVDGTGRPRFRADGGIDEGRIAVVARGEPLQGAERLDAAGLVVAPGFIDVHSHGDWILPLEDHDEILAPLVLQGITTLVTGQCGFSAAPPRTLIPINTATTITAAIAANLVILLLMTARHADAKSIEGPPDFLSPSMAVSRASLADWHNFSSADN